MNFGGRAIRWAAMGAALAAFSVALLGVGYLAGKNGWIYQTRMWIERSFERPPTALPITRTQIITAYHVLNATRIPTGRAYHIEEVNGHIIFVSRIGQLGAIIGDRAVSLPLNVPIGLEALHADGVLERPTFDLREIKPTDLLAVETGPETYDLYASSIAYGEGCVRIIVNKTDLRATADTVELISRRWTPVFRTRDCVPLQNGALVEGSQSGGRMILLNPNTILLSVGAIGNEQRLLDNADTDFGKLIAIPMDGGAPSVYARGFRNPQGLFLSRTGQLWETEHGPQGGDELNLVIRGRDYGWPHVTYGMSYAGRPVPWPYDPAVASHDGYEPPRLAWVPSIGVSNLVAPDPAEFPNWAHHLAVLSLRGNTLHLLRMEGDRVAVDEPVRFDGDRLRDIKSLHDGRLAISTDDGAIIVLSNADLHPDEPAAPATIALGGLDPLLPEAAEAESPARVAAISFDEKCGSCHTVTNEVRVGPPLAGVIGRRIGSYPGYQYSAALQGQTDTWTPARLRQFLNSPRRIYHETAMPDLGLVPWDVDTVIRYLEAHQRADDAQPN